MFPGDEILKVAREMAGKPWDNALTRKETGMVSFVWRTGGVMLLAATLGTALVLIGSPPAAAVEVDQPAPDFRLPSTTGGEISLGDFRGKKWVFLEFYGADFVPT